MLDMNGNILEGSQALTHEDNHGQILPVSFDRDGDGERELFFIEYKYPGYYEGTPRIYTWDDDSKELIEKYQGPENNLLLARHIVYDKGEKRLLLFWREANNVECIDMDFNLRHTIDFPDDSNYYIYQCLDFDADGSTELLVSNGIDVHIMDIYGNILTTLDDSELYQSEGTEEEPVKIAGYPMARDIDNDGKLEIIVPRTKGAAIFGY